MTDNDLQCDVQLSNTSQVDKATLLSVWPGLTGGICQFFKRLMMS